MEFDFNIATFVVGIMSLSGVITNIIVTTINNRKKRYTDLITQRRLRTFQHIIDCSSNCITSLYGIISEEGNEEELVKEFIENKTQIFYNTNYKAAAEKEVREALTLLQNLLLGYIAEKKNLTEDKKKKVFDTMRKGIEYYQAISGVYCKCEWVRIKETTISVKERIDTQKEYFDRVAEIADTIAPDKEALYKNTFEKLVK